ncbi:hypothetical protein HDU97_000612 [Phlyctochytrium planicorne]|nr:hypothetical protein HDU97_000612 [Phlyctochytrium planicorne]
MLQLHERPERASLSARSRSAKLAKERRKVHSADGLKATFKEPFVTVGEDPCQDPLLVNIRLDTISGEISAGVTVSGITSTIPTALTSNDTNTTRPTTAANHADPEANTDPIEIKTHFPIVTSANCRTRSYPRQQKRLDRVHALETAMKVAASGGVAILEGLEDFATDPVTQGARSSAQPQAQLPPLPTLQDAVTTLATKSLMQDLEESGGLTSEQAAVVRRIMTAGDKHRRKLVAQLSLVVARGALAESEEDKTAQALHISAEAASKALGRLRVEPLDRCYPPRTTTANLNPKERAKIIRSTGDYTKFERGTSAVSANSHGLHSESEAEGAFAEEWRREDEDPSDRDFDDKASNPPSFSFNIEGGNGDGDDEDDNDDDGIPLICVESESTHEIRPIPIPDVARGGNEMKRTYSPNLGGGFGGGDLLGASSAISPSASRASSISCISSNETDDSLKFEFPIVTPSLKGPIIEEPEIPEGVEVLPTITIADPSPSAPSPDSSIRPPRKPSAQPSSFTIFAHDPEKQTPGIGGRRRRESLGAPLKLGKLSAYTGKENEGERIVDIDESSSSETSTSSHNESEEEDEAPPIPHATESLKPERVPISRRVSANRVQLETAGKRRFKGTTLHVNTKAKNASDIPSSIRRKPSGPAELWQFRNPKSPHFPKPDWETEMKKANEAVANTTHSKTKKKKPSVYIKKYSHMIDKTIKPGPAGDPDAQFDEDAIAEAEMRRVLRDLQNWVRSVMGEPEVLPSGPQNTPASALPPTAATPSLFPQSAKSPLTPSPRKLGSDLPSPLPGSNNSLSVVAGREFEDLLALSPWKPVMMERGRDKAAILAVETSPPETMLNRIRMNGLVETTMAVAAAAFEKSKGGNRPSSAGLQTSGSAGSPNDSERPTRQSSAGIGSGSGTGSSMRSSKAGSRPMSAKASPWKGGISLGTLYDDTWTLPLTYFS